MSKKKTQKLTKNQLKKLKGGLTYCSDTNCAGNTCGLANSSKDNCGGGQGDLGFDNPNTLSIARDPTKVTPQKIK